MNGFRVKTEYSTGATNILSTNPARPATYYLSAYYGPSHFPFYNEATARANREQRFPGQF